MSIIELFWHLDVSDNTKFLIIIGIIICVFVSCILNGKKNNKKKSKKSNKSNNDLTPCQQNYMQCVNDNMRNNTNNYCYPCLDNGNSPDFFYNPQIGQWVKLN